MDRVETLGRLQKRTDQSGREGQALGEPLWIGRHSLDMIWSDGQVQPGEEADQQAPTENPIAW